MNNTTIEELITCVRESEGEIICNGTAYEVVGYIYSRATRCSGSTCSCTYSSFCLLVSERLIDTHEEIYNAYCGTVDSMRRLCVHVQRYTFNKS